MHRVNASFSYFLTDLTICHFLALLFRGVLIFYAKAFLLMKYYMVDSNPCSLVKNSLMESIETADSGSSFD